MTNILIVDDDINAINNVTAVLLDHSDYRLSLFKDNPLSCLEYASENPVDIAFLDIQMPEIQGDDLAEKLIKINPNIKIVFITGYIYEKERLLSKSPSNIVTILNKPFSKLDFEELLASLCAQEPHYSLSTFGNFDLFMNHLAIPFPSKKSKELLAYLVDRNGKNVTMEEAICALWPDTDLAKAKLLYRDAVWKLRKLLKERHLEALVTFERALTHVNKIIPCDYWEAIEAKKSDKYRGSYLTSYEWSLETQDYLTNLLQD